MITLTTEQARQIEVALLNWKAYVPLGKVALWDESDEQALATIRAARAQEQPHPDDEAVDRFAAAMKAKLEKKRAEGRGGWEDKNQCSAEFLNRLLNEHVGKGDPVDVGNLAMMLWNRGERTEAIAQEQSEQEPVASSIRGFSLWLDREAWGHVIDGLMLERERSAQRKAANPDSNSNYIANRCAELIAQIGEAATDIVQPVSQQPASQQPANRFTSDDVKVAFEDGYAAGVSVAGIAKEVEQEPVAWEHFGIPSVNGKQAEKEPLMDYERINALREGEQNGAEDAYFFVRPENDTPSLRKMFCQGFERGFHKGLKYIAPVRTKDPCNPLQDLTDGEIADEFRAIHMKESWSLDFARAVIAADREKNK